MNATVNRNLLGALVSLVVVGLTSCQTMMADDQSQISDVEKGRIIFQNSCAPCHGASGKGDGYTQLNPPPANLNFTVIKNKSDGELAQSIGEGHPNTAMGAWKYGLSEEEIGNVVKYIRKLGREN